MTEPAYETIDAERWAAMSDRERNDICWRAGTLRHLMHSTQQQWYDKYRAWEAQAQSDDVEFVAGSLPRVFGVEGAKRLGKTTWALAVKHEDCVRRPGSKHRITSAFQKNIGEIIGDVAPKLFEGCPPDVRPEYRGRKGPLGAGLYYPEYGPAQGSIIFLAGVDKNPDALRGQACDSDFISEAAFIGELLYSLKNILYHQYQGRAWARAIVESSAPRDLDTDWELTILPDCKRRNAWVVGTIEDNPLLSRRNKDEFIAAAGGRGNADCEREYFNVIAGDPQQIVVPEFVEFSSTCVREHVPPPFAYCLTAADPGTTHLFGLVFGYLDFDAAKGVIQDSWAGSNASTRKVAAVCAAREHDLWGTWPPEAMNSIPLEGDGKKQGWKELLRGDRCEKDAGLLYELAQTPRDQRADHAPRPGFFKDRVMPGYLHYWDGAEHKPNPYWRVSDVDRAMVADIGNEFGLQFAPTSKDLVEVMVKLVRNSIADGWLEFEPDAGPVLEHTRAGKWDKQWRKFAEHPVYGHFDCLAALVYWVRNAQVVRNRRPHAPARPVVGPGTLVFDPAKAGLVQPPVAENIQALNQLLGFGANAKRRSSYGKW